MKAYANKPTFNIKLNIHEQPTNNIPKKKFLLKRRAANNMQQ